MGTKKPPSTKTIVIGVVLGGIGIAALLGPGSPSTPHNSKTKDVAQTSTTGSPPSSTDSQSTDTLDDNAMKPGAIDTESEPTFAATSSDDVSDLNKFLDAQDKTGVTDMVSNGRAILLDSGTKVKFIDFAGFDECEVRVLSGPFKDQLGYLACDSLKATYNSRPQE